MSSYDIEHMKPEELSENDPNSESVSDLLDNVPKDEETIYMGDEDDKDKDPLDLGFGKPGSFGAGINSANAF